MRRIVLVLPLVLLCWAPAAHAQTLPGICAIRGISYGTAPATGSITVAGGIGCYRLAGAAGDVVRVRLIRTSGTLDPTVGIAPPDGTSGCTATDDEFRCALRVAGQHSLVVRDAAGTATGTYAIAIQRLNDPVGCTTLAFGAAPSVGTIANDGETDCYRFAAAAGDRVHVRLKGTSAELSPVGEVLKSRRDSGLPTDGR